MIDIKHLSKTFRHDTILSDISFHLDEGDVMPIIGSSGAGKSTLLRCINRLEQPEHGEVTIAGEVFNLATLARREPVRLRQSTAMVFQQFSLFQQKTALENMMEGLTIVKKYPKHQAKKVAMAQLNKVGLAERAD